MGDSGTNVRKYIQQFREPPSGCMPNSYEAGATPLYADKTTFQQRTDVGDIRGEYDFCIPKKFRLKKHLSDTLQDGLPDEMTLDRWVAEF